MQLEYRKLSDMEIRDGLGALNGWREQDGAIAKTYEFETYKAGLVFAAAVGYVADKLDHHPDIHIGYRKVDVSVNTHSVSGISPYDFELARRIDLL